MLISATTAVESTWRLTTSRNHLDTREAPFLLDLRARYHVVDDAAKEGGIAISARGQTLTAVFNVDSRLRFGGSFGRADRSDG